MMNQARSRLAPLWTLSIIAMALAGCGKSESEQEAAKPAPAPPPRPTERVERPQQVDVSAMITDSRVQFPEERAPRDEDLARAIVSLATAIANGDSGRLKTLLTEPAQAVLDSLVETGEWAEATAGVDVVRVCALDVSDRQARLGLAVEDERGAYLLSWAGAPGPDGWRFGGLATPVQTADAASGLDGASLAEVTPPEPGEVEVEEEIDPFRGQREREGRGGRSRRSRPSRGIGGF